MLKTLKKKNGRSLVYIDKVFSLILLKTVNFDAKNVKKKNGRSLVYIEKVFLLILLKSLGFDAEKHFKPKWR